MYDMLSIWVKKIRDNNAKKVVELYHDDSLLLGTFPILKGMEKN
jgi:ketosteroid isomerase-like protein